MARPAGARAKKNSEAAIRMVSAFAARQRLVADLSLEKQVLKDVASGNL